MTTFSSTVMASTSLTDVLSTEELGLSMSKIGGIVGMAIVLTTFMEGAILARTKNNLKIPYLIGAAFGFIQMVFNFACLPETLDASRRKALDLKVFLQSLNPFAFVQIYTRGSAALQKAVTCTTLQMSLEGKNLSDLTQLWARNHLNWESGEIKNFIAAYGVLCAVAGMAITPRMMNSLTTFRYTSVTNATNLLGFVMRGAAAKGWLFCLAVLPMLPGVNGSSSNALKALANGHAVAAGFGNGEFSAWTSNLRGLMGAAAPVIFGNYYAFARDRGLPAGSTFALAGVLGALLPELVLRSMKESELRPPPGTASRQSLRA
mmetsp:Transcript_55747/g.148796  ORF Transcript_55747/g.148796 Transcript_55747/m.148796 type:complete len:319 (+) Transcript_55747:91-1047(+)